MKRYYYKRLDRNEIMSLTSPTDDTNCVEITETEYNELHAKMFGQKEPTETEMVYLQELNDLQKWFEMYDRQVQEYSRCVRLGFDYDAKHGTILELDSQAVFNAKRINELRQLLSKGVQ